MDYSYKSPVGNLKISTTDKAVSGLSFSNKKIAQPKKINPVLKQCIKELDAYFAGKLNKFTVPLDLEGTDFQKKVWHQLTKIPHGTTLSYGEVAKKIKNPKAARAVGLANNKNNIAIIVPCHRVIGSNGKLVGYASGVNKKKWLLQHEGV
jgi:methylated-DNA-[protein]-cysteine S-methyltransferase